MSKGPSDPMLLIDGDIFLYRCGFAVEKTKYLVEGHPYTDFSHYDSAKEAKANLPEGGIIWSRREVEPAENAIEATKNALKAVIIKFHPKGDTWKGFIYLTGKGNFRELLESGRGYKDNRDPSHRPKHYRAIKEYLVKAWEAKTINGEEADDAIGKEAFSRNVDSFVIVSNDKDLDQLSGFHYDWTKSELYYVNDEDAIKQFYRQLLSGDATDNIVGVVSKAKAEELINPLQSPEDCAVVCQEMYAKKHGDLWAEKLNICADLVWIRRSDNEEPGGKQPPFWGHYHAK